MFNRQQPPQQPRGQWPQQHLPRRWEYKVLAKVRDPERELNALGAQGWELVAIDSAPTGTVAASRYVLKRPAF